MEIKKHIVLSLAAAVMLSACSKNETPSSGEANLSFSLSTDRTSDEVVLSKAAEEILAADFMLHIENAPLPGNEPEIVYGPVRYSEVPATLRYFPGAYRIVAIHGTQAKMPAFDSPVYRADEKITIAAGENKTVQLNAKLATTKMAVTFDDSFATYYASYSVDIRTIEDEYLTFTPEEKREGYFTPGNIRMRFNLVTKSGENLTFSPSGTITPTPTKAKEFYKLKLSVKSNNGSGSISITTDGSTNDKSVDIDIPAYTLPKAPPLVTPSGFTSEVPVATNQGMFTEHSVSVRTTAGLKSLIVKTTAPDALAAGWPADGIDIVGLTQEMRDKIRTLGLKWSDELNTVEGAGNLTKDAYVHLSGLTGNMTTPSNTTSTQDFSVEAIDKFGQSSGVYTLRLAIAPPVFSLKRIDGDPNIWATKADWTTVYETELQQVTPPTVEYRVEGGAWQKANIEVVESGQATPGAITHRIKGLKSSTLYTFRSVFGTHTSPELSCRTESPDQVPNSNMEEWNKWMFTKGTGSAMPMYDPWVSGEANRTWATNNARTVSYTVFKSLYNCAPAVSYTYTAHGGSKAAEIRTVSGSGSDINSKGVGNNGNRTRGRLFIGDYSYPGSNGDNINYGRPFVTRPTAFTFYYQYMPLNGNDEFEAYIEVKNGNTVIATGLFRSSTEATSWTKAEVLLNYQKSDIKAGTISINFLSTTASQPLVQLNRGLNYADYGNASSHYGSVLRVDDIELTY